MNGTAHEEKRNSNNHAVTSRLVNVPNFGCRIIRLIHERYDAKLGNYDTIVRMSQTYLLLCVQTCFLICLLKLPKTNHI